MVHRAFNPIRICLIAGLCATPVAISQTTSATTMPVTLTYNQAWLQAVGVEQQYAQGYATIGFAPAILTIPDQPFTAQRIYKEWAPSTGTSNPGAQTTDPQTGDQTSGPGKPILTTTVTIARDSQGRIHYESSRATGDVIVMISDPVMHLQYQYEITPTAPATLTAQSCTQPMMSQISQPNSASAAITNPAPDTSAISSTPAVTALPPAATQELGTRNMQGTIAYGQQRIDYLDLQPGIKTMQTVDWFSPSLGVNLRESSNYTGQNNFSVDTNNVVLGPPDPNLFVLPPGYTIPGPTVSCIPLVS